MFSQRLKMLLEEKGKSKLQFVHDLQTCFAVMNLWERQEIIPDIQTAVRIADYFDVSLDYLVGRSDDPTRR